MQYIPPIIEAFNIPVVMVKNYEADDAFNGTLAKTSRKGRIYCLYGDTRQRL
ncbi:MAG: hypothetical protein IPJ39_21940 [Saprospiraceae bacterium]|nr:hypothetical protein [Saprospiraceae bacterium]